LEIAANPNRNEFTDVEFHSIGSQCARERERERQTEREIGI